MERHDNQPGAIQLRGGTGLLFFSILLTAGYVLKYHTSVFERLESPFHVVHAENNPSQATPPAFFKDPQRIMLLGAALMCWFFTAAYVGFMGWLKGTPVEAARLCRYCGQQFQDQKLKCCPACKPGSK